MKMIIQFKSIDSFSTARLIAKKINASDLDKFIVMNADPKVMGTLGGVRIEQSKQDLERHLSRWKENGFGSWIFI
jgi:[ribosomal protein S5]-alanine N-acetyltransferase